MTNTDLGVGQLEQYWLQSHRSSPLSCTARHVELQNTDPEPQGRGLRPALQNVAEGSVLQLV